MTFSGYPIGTTWGKVVLFLFEYHSGGGKTGHSNPGVCFDSVIFISFFHTLTDTLRMATEEGCHSINVLAQQLWQYPLGMDPASDCIDRMFWPFRLDCKLPMGRAQVLVFLPSFSSIATHKDG